MEKAIEFIRSYQDGPFFCFLPLAIPHASMHVPEKYAATIRKTFSEQEYKIGKYKWPNVKNPAAMFACMLT